MRVWMKIAFALCAGWLLLPASLWAQDSPARIILRDETAGYALPLPAGWQEATGAGQMEALTREVCSLFMRDGSIPGASHMRGAFLPEAGAASPALVVFALDYGSLGLDVKAVQDIAKDSRTVVTTLANALQTSYMQMFPQSIMINSHLGDDFFSLNLRSVLDFADERRATRNQHVKVMLSANGAVVLMTRYDGPPDATLDAAIAASVRETLVPPEKALQRVNPPYQASPLDYLLLAIAIVVAVVVAGKLRRAMRG